MSNEILVVVADAVPVGTLLSVASKVGGPVHAAVAGPRDLAELVARSGVESVSWYVTDDETPAEAYVTGIADAVALMAPRVVLAPNAAASRCVAGAIAARMDAAVASSVMSVSLDGGRATVERSIAERRAVETIETDACVVGLVLDGAEDVPVDGEAEITTASVGVFNSVSVVATHEDSGSGESLAGAERVVGAGRGIVSKEELSLVEDLAEALGAEVACSLSLCDDYHWFEHSRVVGTSTQRISPRLYVSVGISGQPQHMTGVRGAKTIVAVNNDPEAPIFRECDFGIVGDLKKVVPALTAALKGI